MNIAVHNPSSVDISTVRVAVPQGLYNVYTFNLTTQKFDLLLQRQFGCYKDTKFGGDVLQPNRDLEFYSCWLTMHHLTKARDISLLLVNRLSNPIDIVPRPIEVLSSIENANSKLTFVDYSTHSELSFEYQDKGTGRSETVAVSLKYWRSWINHNAFIKGAQNSGVYNFRPETGQYEA
jgi:hypothetical protein